MAAQALYRVWRSQTFDELVGQEHVVHTLRNALVEGRIAHAYLFTGPRGVGKTTMARLLAKAVNCTHPDVTQRPCGQCESCVAVAEGRAIDVIELDAASHTSVEDAREIIERVQFRPSSSTYKVYVIDECFRYDELVTLADGSKVPIGKIVEEQWQTSVLSYNEQTGQIEPKPIVRHMRKQPSLPMVRVTFNNNRAVVCTLSHKFYTPQGMLRAGELEPGQFVYANFERMTQHQLNVVAGAALGDGYIGLTDSKMRGRLSLTQGVAQKDYLDYKVQLLGDLAQTAPAYHYSDKTFSKTGVYHFSTTSRPQIAQLHHELYDTSGRKRITLAYLEKINALGLALWYLDDGSLITANHKYTRKDGGVSTYPATRSTLSAYGFLPDEARLICSWLQERWGVEARVTITAKGPVIWLTLAGTDRLHQIVAPHVPPSMEYKLLPPYRGHFSSFVDDMLINGLATSRVKRVERVPSTEFVYNIEVADNHNYFVRDILVSNCHMLSTAAFNALLKTLEEPPAHALFILATTEVHKVPATILSRCQRFNFARHSVAATVDHLAHIAQSEGLELEPAAAEIIARAATGSMRDALSVLDQLRAYDNHITAELARSLLGSSAAAEVTALVDALLDADMAAALRAVNGVADQGADLRQFARDLVERLRALLLLSAGGERELHDMGEDELETLRAQSSRATTGGLLAWVKLFSALDFQLRTSPYGQLPLELAVVESLLAPAPSAAAPVAQRPAAPTPARPAAQPPRPAPAAPAPKPQPAEATAQAPQPAPPLQPAPLAAVGLEPAMAAATPEPAPSVTSPAEPATMEATDQPTSSADTQHSALDAQHAIDDLLPPVLDEPAPAAHAPPTEDAAVQAANADIATLEQIEAVWPQVLRDVRVFDKTLQALLNSGVRPSDVEDNVVVLEVGSDFIYSKLEKPNFRQIIERVLSKHTGGSYGIRCVVETQQRENPNDLRTQIRRARQDEWVRAAINVFDADVVAVEQPDPAL